MTGVSNWKVQILHITLSNLLRSTGLVCLQKGSGISLWSLWVSKDLVPDSIQVFINRNIYPECKEGFVVTEGNGGFETLLVT